MKNEEKLALLVTLSNTVEDEIKKFVSVDPHIMHWSGVKQGKHVAYHYCQRCGHLEEEFSNSSYYGAPHSCVNCGNTVHYNNMGYHYRVAYGSKFGNDYIWARDIDGGFEAAIFTKKITRNDSGQKEWYKIPLEALIAVQCLVRFTEEDGLSVYQPSKTTLEKSDSAYYCDIKHMLVNNKNDISNMKREDFESHLKQMLEYESNRIQKKESKKNNSKTALLNTMREKYKPNVHIDPSVFSSVGEEIFRVRYNSSSESGESTSLIYCTKCKTVSEIKDGTYTELSCPHCNNTERSFYMRGSGSVFATAFESTNLPENDFLMRIFEIKRKFSVDNGFEESVEERVRIFFGKKINTYIKQASGAYNKGTVHDIPTSFTYYYSNINDIFTIQSDEDVANAIANSCLRYSGLIEAWSLGDKRYVGYEKAPALSYLLTWYKKPAIELIMKANNQNFTQAFVHNPERIGTGKTLAEALMVQPAVAKMTIKHKLTYDQMVEANVLYTADSSLTYEIFNALYADHIHAGTVVELYRQHGISYGNVVKYLQTVYDHQCIEKRDAINIWADYLRMAKALRIDLTDKTRLYPQSLKKEHDVAVFAYKTVRMEMDKTQFATQAEINSHFEYTYKDYMVIIPRTPEEIVEEATRQKNCLRSYVERVKNGATVVAFIREKETPDQTFLTAEIRDNSLVQLKGYCNSNPRGSKINEFVQHWAKARGIRIAC